MFAAAACCLLFTSIGWSQDQLLDELYGRGVHNYFARNYTQAHQFLTEAATSGSQDPRVYYFRALTYSKLGRPDDAKADFEKGAAFEVQLGDIFPIGRSLERVQGNDRIALESYRRNARLLARGNTNKIEGVRYEEMKRNEAAVLRNPNARGGTLPPPAAVAPAANDPFGGAAPAADPFGGAGGAPAAPPEAAPLPGAPAGADPFNAPEAAPPAPVAPAPMPAAPAAADPFGPAAPAAPPAAAPPAAEPGAADPFGPAAPAEPPAAAPPAAPAADPFGAAPAVPADPFGAGVAPAPAAPAAAPAVAGGKSTIGSLMRAFTKAIPDAQPTGIGAPMIDPAVRPAGGDAQIDPFKDDAPAPGPPGPGRAAPPAADPFGAPAAPVPMPAPPAAPGAEAPNAPEPPAADPFGAAPAPAAPAPAPAAPPADDPFG